MTGCRAGALSSLAVAALASLWGVGPLEAQRVANLPLPERPEALLARDDAFAAPSADGKVHRLPNGALAVVIEDRSLPLFELAAAIPVGEVLDSAESLGVASVTGALLRRGGAGGLSAREFDLEVEHLGFKASSVGGFRRSGVSLSGASSHLQRGIELFSAMLTTPSFDQSAVLDLKRSLVDSLSRRNDNPSSVLEREWKWLVHGADGLQARQLETRHTEGIARDVLLSFHRRCYGPEGTVIAVSGDVETAEVLAALERSLGTWAAMGPCTRVGPLSLNPASAGIRVVDFEGGQALVVVGHRGIRRASWDDPEAWALLLLNEVLAGSGAVSRLGSRLRAREGLVYQVSGSFGIGSVDEGVFEVYFATDAASVGGVIDLVAEEMLRLQNVPVVELELDLAKRSLIDSFPLLFETSESIAGRLAEDLLLGRPHDYWRLYRERVAAVGAADLQRVANRFLFPESLRGVVVGPASTVLRSLKQSARSGRGVELLPPRDPVTLDPQPGEGNPRPGEDRRD